MSFQHDKRVIIYPHYIDSTRTTAEGRRIPKELGCPYPNVVEMLDCCKYLKLPAEIEDKHYCRDWFIRGRLRVQLKNDDGTLSNPEIPNRRTMLVKIAEIVPKHPSRKGKNVVSQQQQAVADAASAAAAAASGSGEASSSKAATGSSTASGSGSSKSNKKKGKK